MPYTSLDCDDETTVQVSNFFTQPAHQQQHTPQPDFSCFVKQQQHQQQIHLNKHTSPTGTVQLNVGGQLFTTTWSTLTSVPDTYFTTLHRSGQQWQDNPHTSNNTLFIDRDGSVFGYILNYLRDNHLPFIQHCRSVALLQCIYTEANYYMLNDLCQMMQDRIQQLIDLEHTEHTKTQRIHDELHSAVVSALNTPLKSQTVSRSNSECVRTAIDGDGSSGVTRTLSFQSSRNLQLNGYADIPVAGSRDWQFTTSSDF